MWDRAVLLYALIKGWSIDIGVTLLSGMKTYRNIPIMGAWLNLTLKKHNKALKAWILKQHRKERTMSEETDEEAKGTKDDIRVGPSGMS
ncbi:hypothetical protein ACH5RR_021736 [Cinchona calisaya]|uniref:Uncharacterized protein n=1 Tax=Cinchona calisaya TaxID=153742 RepID=A0ABD2ZI72_9GENT